MDSSSTQLNWNDETPHDGTIYHKDKRSLTVTSLVVQRLAVFLKTVSLIAVIFNITTPSSG